MTNKTNVFKALAEVQRGLGRIGHDGSSFHGGGYTTVDRIIGKLKPLLDAAGLAVVQLAEGDGLRTIVCHTESGETVESFIKSPSYEMAMNSDKAKPFDMQTVGGEITYMRRYSLTSMFMLMTGDEDLDNEVYYKSYKKKEEVLKEEEKKEVKETPVETPVEEEKKTPKEELVEQAQSTFAVLKAGLKGEKEAEENLMTLTLNMIQEENPKAKVFSDLTIAQLKSLLPKYKELI